METHPPWFLSTSPQIGKLVNTRRPEKKKNKKKKRVARLTT